MDEIFQCGVAAASQAQDFHGHIEGTERKESELLELDELFCTQVRMFLDDTALIRVEHPRLAQDIFGDVKFAEVMEKGAEP